MTLTTKLYSELARVYHEMYLSIFDYEKEFLFYDELLKKYNRRSVLEIGCGSGNLAPYFLKAGYEYLGLDLFDEMIQIAKENNPDAAFVQGDMRALNLEQTFDAVLITGRSLCYVTTNQGVMQTFQSIYKTLKEDGILIFDSFKADEIILNLKEGFTQDVEVGDTKYKRVNRMKLNLETGWTWDWEADYHIEKKGEEKKVVKDKTLLRAFTEDELKIFLQLNGFEVLEVIKENVFTFIAKRQGEL
ncbi:MAG: class I SAM-dependent methyltransferase [bacterium]|nr:class I SAM-dependent methyltransferase [bacterium]